MSAQHRPQGVAELIARLYGRLFDESYCTAEIISQGPDTLADASGLFFGIPAFVLDLS